MENLSYFYFTGTLFSCLLVGFIIYYVILHQKKINDYNLQLKEQELKNEKLLLIALSKSEEKERKRLAEELHDGIGAKLSGIKMSLEYLTTKNNPELTLIKKINNDLNESIEDLREISHNLKPISFLSKGLINALEEFLEHLNKNGQCKFSLYFENVESVITQEIQFIAFRIICELLNNINKHAFAKDASVQILLNDEGNLQIIAEDNGIGMHDNSKNGIGLTNIKDRVASLNGSINIDSSSFGTTIIINFPLI